MKMDELHDTLAAQRDELEQLHLELERRAGRIKVLETQLKVRSRWDEDLRQVAENLDAQLLARDKELLARDEEIAELRRAEDYLRKELAWRQQNEESLRRTEEYLSQVVESLQERIAAIEGTRLWRVGQRYWSLKAGVRTALRRNSQ
jgi:septal ring factor EnvC (AmiA/AmiB activator)